MADLFKAPLDMRMENDENFRYFSPSSQSLQPHKRKRSAKNVEYGEKRRRRTAEDFLMFCRIILEHENYEQIRSQDLRLRHSSSPLGSTGSSNESWPLSKDEFAEMYSPPHHHHSTMEDEDDKNSTEEDRDTVSEDDSWDQVTCYCGKPFAGRPMIECSKCLIWIHLKCAGLRRTHIPDTWHCAKCKSKSETSPRAGQKSETRGQKPEVRGQKPEVGEKPVSGSRKRKSTKQVHHNSNAASKIDVESVEDES